MTGAAVDIPGVVKGGTPIERILTGYDGLDDPIGLTDGTLVFSEPGARRLHRMNTRTNEVSVLVADSNESHGVTEDAKGRLISAQAWDGSTRIGVIHPPESRAVLADTYEGRPFSRPNDLIVARNGGVYFNDPGLTVQQAEALVKRLGKPLEPRLPPAVYYIPPGGRAIRIEDKMIRPNGIQLSRDEKTLYSSDSNGSDIIAWVSARRFRAHRSAFCSLIAAHLTRLAGQNVAAADDRQRRPAYVATVGGIEVLSARGGLGTIFDARRRLPYPRVQRAGKRRCNRRRRRLYKVEMIARDCRTSQIKSRSSSAR